MAFTQTNKPRFVGCKETSTYRWELYLTNGYVFDGYSANVGMAEKQDKQALLQDCISRLLNNGYLDKCYQMQFFKRTFLHRSKDILILELFADHYKAHDELTLDLQTTNFLDRVYGARKTETGLDYAKLLPPRPTGKFREAERIDFEFSKEKFPTLDALAAYCRTLLVKPKSYSRTRVEAWYHKCRHYYNANQAQPQTSPLVRPASANVDDLPADPDNVQMVQNAKNAVVALQGKLNVTPNMRRQ